MNGAESIVRTLLANQVDTCFANPGTSEMHLVQALDQVPEFRAILCLFEGVCTGAADGYARMRGLPATTLLHLGPGLGNGLANLHNCRRAASPLINLVGDHAGYHTHYDAPLTSDVEAVAKPFSNWIRKSKTSQGLANDVQDAFIASMSPNPDPNGAISTLIVPTDCAWGEGIPRVDPVALPTRSRVPSETIERVAPLLDQDTILLIDGNALAGKGLEAAGRIAAATGCRLFTPTFPARIDNGPSVPSISRIPYFPEQILSLLANVRRLVLAGGTAPVSFFAYQKLPSYLVPETCEVIHCAHRHEDTEAALLDLGSVVGVANTEPISQSKLEKPPNPSGKLSGRHIAAILARNIPDNSIVAIDSGGGGGAYDVLQDHVDHSWLSITGGSIGQGGPVGLGASIACPDRPVISLLGDGGALYTLQYLWSAAREKAKQISVIYSNRQYNILEVEYLRMGVNAVGDRAASLFSLANPQIDWVTLSESMGVPSSKAESCEEFQQALTIALDCDGPYLIEAVV